MATVPLWLIGRNVTACSINPQTETAGTLADTSAQTLVGQLDEIGLDFKANQEEINPLDSVRENFVTVTKGTRITLTEILKSSGTNFLATAATGANDAVKVTLTRGAQTWLFYGRIDGYSEGLKRGKSTGTLSIAPIDSGAANPTYS